MRRRSRLSRPVVLGLAALLSVDLILVAAYALGLRVNATASMPEGLYRLTPYRAESLSRGTVVAICPSADVVAISAGRHYLAPGRCPGSVEPLLKHIAAVSGDTVDVSDGAISVNGKPLANSGRLARDCAERPLSRIAAGRYRLGPRTVWLYAPVARSWDSRYFGPQPVSGIVGIATPILIVGPGRACS